MARGKVYIASKNMRGKWADKPLSCKAVDVTSSQFKLSKYRRDFSPMHSQEGGYKAPDGHTYLNFEHYWQGGKVWEDLPPETARAFFRAATKPTRRLPASKKREVMYGAWENFPSQQMEYIESRKRVYVPFYHEYMHASESFAGLKKQVDAGQNVVVYDFDGPRLHDKQPTCMEVTLDLLKEKINHSGSPFGHGSVVAAALAGIQYKDFTD